jgi:hypothetical protein
MVASKCLRGAQPRTERHTTRERRAAQIDGSGVPLAGLVAPRATTPAISATHH